VRLIIALARLLGTRAVADLVQALEGDEEEAYESQPSPEVESIAADERRHAEIWRELRAGNAASSWQPDGDGSTAHAAGSGAATSAVSAEASDPAIAAAIHVHPPGAHAPSPSRDRSTADIAARERWHRAGQTGTLRATIFGVNDGLVSNLALVMGVAGAGPEPQIILLAGIAGLLAGAFSMAAG
jgi:hypothetical protein